MNGLKVVIWLAAGLGLLLIALPLFGQHRWQAKTNVLTAQLHATQRASAPVAVDFKELDGLPTPVKRYLQTALQPGQAVVRGLRMEHSGTFNMGEQTDQWKSFTATQQVTTNRPGFVWNAAVAMMPGVPVRVHDAYVAGEGILNPAILGLFNLADMRGGGEIAQGEFMRFVAEAAWYPTALLPSQGARWQAVDDTSAMLRLSDGIVQTEVLFRFNAEGLIESIRVDARGRTVGGQIVMTPWEGQWSDYQRIAGMLVPMAGEVAWITPQGRKPYWRAKVTQLDYQFADQ